MEASFKSEVGWLELVLLYIRILSLDAEKRKLKKKNQGNENLKSSTRQSKSWFLLLLSGTLQDDNPICSKVLKSTDLDVIMFPSTTYMMHQAV